MKLQFQNRMDPHSVDVIRGGGSHVLAMLRWDGGREQIVFVDSYTQCSVEELEEMIEELHRRSGK